MDIGALDSATVHSALSRRKLFGSINKVIDASISGRVVDVDGVQYDDKNQLRRMHRRSVLLTRTHGGIATTRATVGTADSIKVADCLPVATRLAPEQEMTPTLPDRIMFSPLAFAELLAEFAAVAFSVQDAPDVYRREERWLGEKLGPPGLSVVDDPAATGGWPIDLHGRYRSHVPLVERGVAIGAVTAVKEGGAPGARSDIPELAAYPADLVMSFSQNKPCGLETAPTLHIGRVHYVSVIDAHRGILTASTRDTVWLYRPGKPAAAVGDMRITVAMPDLLSGIVGTLPGSSETVPVSWGGVVVRCPFVVCEGVSL
ncbi:metallopeptidase TldD-related protein [Rhodococcus sp. 06-235-1A]|uniref:metallopeptidase TldD-related protein n=1 Tax=Rhodococcus sp. 06-235-1A TaxID=2022508 RepID=UPI0015C60C95|nr:metallopeptidase TldD-related protein [Rhodococcus sp. 06-235-1A]